MQQARLNELSKIYPFKQIEYVYSEGQLKSVIIDIEDFFSLVETLEVQPSVPVDSIPAESDTEMSMAEKRAFAKSIKGKYKHCLTNSERFSETKKQ
jgi:hypothetical protein